MKIHLCHTMNWTHLNDMDQLAELDDLSTARPVLIFKHSTRCSISGTALARLERHPGAEQLEPAYFLDLLRRRDISDAIEARYGIMHASPQVLVIRGGQCLYHKSHLGIVFDDVAKAVERAQ